MNRRPLNRLLVLAMSVTCAAVLLASGVSTNPRGAAQIPAPEYWPTGGWHESTPERQGIDSASLLKVFDYVREHHTRVHNVLIIRNGFVVLDASFFPYRGDMVHDLASVTKSVTSTLIGAAIQDGKISGVDASVLSFFSQNQQRDGEKGKQQISISDLLTMRSGLTCETKNSEEIIREMMHSADWVNFVLNLPMRTDPGKRFEYCSGNYHLLSAIISKSTSMNEADYARTALFAPLGIHEAVWPNDQNGITHGWGDLHLFPRDAAKIGFLWLHDGIWDGKRLLAESWTRNATTALTKTTSRDAGYGYGFWAFTGKRAGEYEALGRGGQRITILPQLNAIVVLTGGGFEPDEIGGILGAAVKSDHALPENPVAVEKLHQAIQSALEAPPAGATSTLSPIAKTISGKTFSLGANPLDLRSFSLQFPDQASATFEMTVGSARQETHAVSLNQRPAFSPGEFGLPVALSGRWEGDEFVLNYDEVANNHAYQIRMRFKGNDVVLQASDPNGKNTVAIHGVAK
jgi:CubicO group peptidase (beta-lactamase class C family)